jgi:hypothetical protein
MEWDQKRPEMVSLWHHSQQFLIPDLFKILSKNIFGCTDYRTATSL